MDDYFSSVSQAYDNIGDDITLATEVGDLVLCRTSGGFAGHLFVLVDPSTGTFLTACHDRGVVAVRRSLVKSVVGVYRCLKKA